MDHTQLLHTLQNAISTSIWYLIPLFILAMVIKSPWFKGKAGEAMVNRYAKLFLDKIHYHLIENVTLPTEDGTTEIDHIIVSDSGTSVVVNKNIKEWVFGNSKPRNWSKKFWENLI